MYIYMYILYIYTIYIFFLLGSLRLSRSGLAQKPVSAPWLIVRKPLAVELNSGSSGGEFSSDGIE